MTVDANNDVPADADAPRAPLEPHPRGHIPALDAIRGVAILAVMLYHFSRGAEDGSTAGRLLSRILGLGDHGVDLFFVLSGFLITGILFDSRHAAGYFRNFYARRVLRIFPLYYGVLFAIFIVGPLVIPGGLALYREGQRHQAWLWLYASNLWHAAYNSWDLGSFSHFWSLAVEEHFYLLWPVVIFTCSRARAMQICVTGGLLAIACRFALALTGDHATAIYVLTPTRMGALFVGSYLALAARGPAGLWPFTARLRWAFAGCALFIGLDLALAFRGVQIPLGLWTLRYTLFSVLSGALLLQALSAAPGSLFARLWDASALRFLGKYSYGLYVFHYLLDPVYRRLVPIPELAGVLGSSFVARLVFLAAAIAATIVVALLSWHLFEKHFLRLKAWFPSAGTPVVRALPGPVPQPVPV